MKTRNSHSSPPKLLPLTLTIFCGLLGGSGLLQAQTTLIDGSLGNGNFEAPNVTGGTNFSTNTIVNWASWTEKDTIATDTGIYDSPTAGSQAAYFQNGGAIRNMTTHVIQAGDIINYGFTDVIGARGEATAFLVYDNAGVITEIPATALTAVTTTNNTIISGSYTVPPGSTWIGKTLGIGLFSNVSYPEVDNVTLSAGQPPANVLYWDGASFDGNANGGGGTWNTAATNWDTAATAGTDSAWVQGGNAIFAGNFNGLITLGSPITANRLIFDLAGYVVSGDTLTLTGADAVITTNQNVTISSAIGNSTAITKNGSATLTLGGDGSAFTGTLTNAAGPLVITSANWGGTHFAASGNTLTFSAGGTVTAGTLNLGNAVRVNNGTLLNITGGAITQLAPGGGISTTAGATGTLTSSSGALTFTDGIPGTKAVTVPLADFNGTTPLTVTLDGPGGSEIGSMSFVANTHTGGTTINKGRFSAANIAAFGSGGVNIYAGGQTYLTAQGIYPNNFTIAGSGWTEGVGELGAIRFEGTGQTLSGTVTVGAAGSRIVSYLGAVGTISGGLLGSGNLEINSEAVTNANGTVNLTGSSAGYSGTVTVSRGRLNVASALGGSVVVTDNGRLGGEGTIAGDLRLGTISGTGAELVIDPSTPGQVSTGNLTLEGHTRVTLAGNPPSAAPIPILKYSGTLTNNSGGTLAGAFTIPGSYRNGGIIDNAKTLELTILTETHQWTGGASMLWEVGGTAANWTSADTFFFNGDSITFGDTGAGTVTLNAPAPVAPASVTFSNTPLHPYIIDGTGSISGTAHLTIDGGGTVTLMQNHSFTGGTTVNNGRLELAEPVNDGIGNLVGTVTVNSGGTLIAAQTNTFGWSGVANSIQTLNINGGSVHTLAAGDNGWGLVVNMTGGELGNQGNGTSYVTMGGDTAVGSPAINTFAAATPATISANLQIRTGNTGNTLDFTVANGTAANDLVVSGSIVPVGAPLGGILKTGPGTMLLSGTNTYTGVTEVQQGSLSLANRLSIPADLTKVTVSAGAGFGGIVGASNLSDTDIQNLVNTVNWAGGAYLVIDTNGADVTVAANITGNIGILKKGAGVLTLTGTNTYTGGYIIEDGSIGNATTVSNVSITKNGTSVSLNFTATGNVDVHASDTLLAPWTKVGSNVSATPFVETGVTSPRRFYVVVPAGQVFPTP